jgi:putative hydrolase of the HAD superfamily
MARLNVVFDFGAVLFTWEPHMLMQAFFPAQASNVENAKALASQVFSHADWHAFDAGHVSQTEVTQRTQQRLGLDLHTLTTLIGAIPDKLQPIESSISVLEKLRDQRDAGDDLGLYFLSNMPAPYARVLERRHTFLDYFDDGIFSGDVKLAKPEAAIFELATQRFNLHNSQTVFIDDLQANIDASLAHGWQGVHLQEPSQLHDKLSVHLRGVSGVL